MGFEVMIPDVQKLMVMEAAVAEHRAALNPHHSMTWDAYHPLKDMYSYLDYLEKHYDYVTTEVIGKSFKGRKMRLAKVCRGGCGHKPAVWIDGGMHARELITPEIGASTLQRVDPPITRAMTNTTVRRPSLR